ncbi:putative methyltransferase [Periconia macrospinosa]|uniref:Putative methyltransferase n=1 Tax=Periconia macrospinosa TaxID=97972 RepID=A0A2V1D379_9PLEO|nr:putative methyltransferase [Periconia macrospinosa]
MEDPIQPQAVPLGNEKVDEFSGTEGVYLLPHHREEIERLQRQHEFIKAATNNKLTPLDLPEGARVLDSGCADGNWLADLAKVHYGRSAKTFSLHGIDLGSTLFRADPRLDLRKHDVRTPVPSSWGWKNSFDLVHQRLLVWGIGKDEWTAVVSNLADLVKPGGTLQLVEAEWVLSSYADNMPQQKKLAQIQEWSCNSSGMDVHIWRKFPELLKGLGFEDVREESFDLGYGATSKRVEDRVWTAELLPQSFRHLARKMPDDAVADVARTPEEYLEFLDELVKEMKAIGYTPKVKWVTARKP